jgi:UDP-N-acetylmuramate dehydrogenase
MQPPAFIQQYIPLAPLTTLGVGGAARFFATIQQESEIPVALAFAAQYDLPVFVLGGGSNLVIADAGFSGLVIHIALRGIASQLENACARVCAAAGEPWDVFVAHCVGQGWTGLECLSGIPGSVGGTPVQNVGAYGQEVSETIASVRAFDRQIGQIVELSNAECQFEYRRSRFNTLERDRFIVLAVTYMLHVNGAPALRYADLKQFFAASNTAPTLADVRAAVLTIRRRKAMVLDPADPDTRSAGSFFKNPVISNEAFIAMESNARTAGWLKADEVIPHYPADEGQLKVPAAWLIEHAGFAKGYTHGNVGLSSKHSLALINRSGARSSEVVELMREIQSRVQARFGLMLIPEPILLGFEQAPP